MTARILLPLDLAQDDDAWDSVIDEAIGMAQRRHAELHVLWVVPALERNLRRMPEDKKPELEAFLKRRFPPDVVVKGHVRGTMEAPHRAIRTLAEELGANLIIMGARNPSLKEHLMGSTASQVTLYAKCSVYVVR
jgi:nucleotide-binding universal stress UspA family protein